MNEIKKQIDEISKKSLGYLDGLALLETQIGATDWALYEGGYSDAARAALKERSELCRRRDDVRRTLRDLEEQRRPLQARLEEETSRAHRAAVLGASREYLLAAVESASAGVLAAAADLEDAQRQHAEAVQRVEAVQGVQDAARSAADALTAARSASYLSPSSASTSAEKQARAAAEKAGDEAERARAARPQLQQAADLAAEKVQEAQDAHQQRQHAHKRARTALAAFDVRQAVEALRAPLEALRAADRSVAADLARAWSRDGLHTLSEENHPEAPAWLWNAGR